VVTFGPFSFNSARGELAREGATVRLTEAEVALLRVLAARPGEVISREDLAKRTGAGLERSVDVQVTRLRRKMKSIRARLCFCRRCAASATGWRPTDDASRHVALSRHSAEGSLLAHAADHRGAGGAAAADHHARLLG
jgi:hypothetical protein